MPPDKNVQHVSIKAHCKFSLIFPHSSSRTPLVNLPKRPHYLPESTQKAHFRCIDAHVRGLSLIQNNANALLSLHITMETFDLWTRR